MPADHAIEITAGLTSTERHVASELYWLAFGQKLGPILGDAGPALIAQTLNPDRAIVAREGSTLVGLAGVQYGGRALVGIDWPSVRRTYGWIGGTRRYLFLALLERTNAPGELVMDGVVVVSSHRGRGVGSRLLDEVMRVASNEGLHRVRLDVVDTNPGARRLYERLGFTATNTVRVPWFRRWMGFGAATTMIKSVDETTSSAGSYRPNR